MKLVAFSDTAREQEDEKQTVDASDPGFSDLKEAARLVESAAFNMANTMPSAFIAQLIVISANLEQLTQSDADRDVNVALPAEWQPLH